MSTRTQSQKTACAHMQIRRRRLKAVGQWQPYVAAEPVRQHLRLVNATGMPFRAICERLGLPNEASLQHLMWGRGTPQPGEKVQTETAQLVLSYWPSLQDFPDPARIDATGTRRRIQALAVRGWSRNSVARKIGMREDNFRKAISQDRVTARVARQVVAAYDEMWNQDPLDHGVSRNAVARIRKGAERAGFHGPLAWDDDTIDDPKAVPVTDAVPPVATEGENVADRWLHGESVILGLEDRRQVVQHLMEWTNSTAEEIADQMQMTVDAVWQVWTRIKKKARDEGRTEPWRRVYVPRERNLNQNQMEEAA
jgi:hypothetical protein